MLGPKAGRPRDVDIVVEDVSLEELSGTFGDFVFRRNRFGGLQLALRDWSVDVWPLSSTWAFKQTNDAAGSFFRLPQTTFLNIEAVAVDLTGRAGKPRQVYSSGFFDSLERRVLELNYPDNPFPALCVVRSLVMSNKLGFAIGQNLRHFIRTHAEALSLDDLIAVQKRHYGRLFMDTKALAQCLDVISRSTESVKTVRLPALEPTQLELADLDLPVLV
jgi:hypothetical protein